MRQWNWQDVLNRTLAFLVTLGDVLMVFIQTVIVAFGTIIIMGFLLWVEQNAVSYGVATFEHDETKTAAAALVLVLFNFAVKFWEVYIDDKASDQRERYKPAKRYVFSLRTWFSEWGYWLGVGKKWQRKELPASASFASVRKVVTFAMLYMAFIGRTHEAINKVSITGGTAVSWQNGFTDLLTKSTLADIALWVSAIVFTFAAVIAAQQLTQYIAVRVLEIKRHMGKSKTVAVARSMSKPVLAYDSPRELSPVKVKVGSQTKYRCPQCAKEMSRQAWHKHPCRFTDGYAAVDGQIDAVAEADQFLDTVDVSVDRQPVKVGVNGSKPRATERKPE